MPTHNINTVSTFEAGLKKIMCMDCQKSDELQIAKTIILNCSFRNEMEFEFCDIQCFYISA